ncbi:MAG: MurR/RpiR family transcriptional regulator [Clostridia bacterium]|nr:MurR/RpiR family transcriptional regulator [Clostridia bacterium]
MQDSQELLQRLNRRGEPLSKGHKRIADYIGAHYDKAVSMTAGMLGKACDVSESTVVRFAYAMGYEGYPEMQQTLRSLVRQRLTAEQRFVIASEIDPANLMDTVLRNDMQNIRKTVEEIPREAFQQAVEAIIGARRIYITGLRSAAPLAQFMYHYLHQICDDVVLAGQTTVDACEEVERITDRDVLIGISFPRYSRRTLECMRLARESGATVIGLTDSEMSPLKDASHICLCAATEMAGFVDSLAAPLSLINALVLAAGLSRRDALREHFKRLENIWDAHSVYAEQGKG